MEIELSKISLTGWNPRKTFDTDSLEDLKQSILEHGILEPLLVRPDGNGGFQLVAGERRYRSAKALNIHKVPVIIKDLTDQQVREIMLLENLQREDLTPFEEAEALHQLLEHGITQRDLAKRLGKSQPWIANRLRILDTPEDLKPYLISREISPKHLMILFRYKEYGPLYRFLIRKLVDDIKEDGLISVRSMENRIENWISWEATQKDLAFDLNPSSWEAPVWWPQFDFSECKTCKHRIDDTCLNRSCFKNKANIAKQKYEKKLQELRNKTLKNSEYSAKGGIVIDTSKLNWGTYETFGYHRSLFDISTCEGCEFFKKDMELNDICTNPDCFKKKLSTHSRTVSKFRREEETEVLNTLYNYIAMSLMNKEIEISTEIAKAMLEHFIEISYSVDDVKAFNRFGIKKWGDAEKIWEHIKDDYTLKIVALVTLYTRKMVGRYKSAGRDKLTFEDLQRVLPAAYRESTREIHLEAKEGEDIATVDIVPGGEFIFSLVPDKTNILLQGNMKEEAKINTVLDVLQTAKEYFSRETIPEKYDALAKKMLQMIHAAIEIEREREAKD